MGKKVPSSESRVIPIQEVSLEVLPANSPASEIAKEARAIEKADEIFRQLNIAAGRRLLTWLENRLDEREEEDWALIEAEVEEG